VEKCKWNHALGSNGELFAEPNQSRATARLAKRLAELVGEWVLMEKGLYQKHVNQSPARG